MTRSGVGSGRGSSMAAPGWIELFTGPLEALGVPYMVTGSVASTLYGEPRLTLDVDLVVEIAPERVAEVLSAFPEGEFYRPPLEVARIECRRESRGHFNLIHHETGMKADVYVAGQDELHRFGPCEPAARGDERRSDLRGSARVRDPAQARVLARRAARRSTFATWRRSSRRGWRSTARCSRERFAGAGWRRPGAASRPSSRIPRAATGPSSPPAPAGRAARARSAPRPRAHRRAESARVRRASPTRSAPGSWCARCAARR